MKIHARSRSGARGGDRAAAQAVVSGGTAKNRRRTGGTGVAWAWRGRGGAVRERRRCRGARVGAVGRARQLRRTGAGRRFREEEGAVTDARGPQKG